MTEPLVELERKLGEGTLLDSFAVADQYLRQFDQSARIAICVMFFYLNVLLYAQYSNDDEYFQTEERLRNVYNASNIRFGDIPEYLFFAGYLSAVSYWLFGEDSAEPSRNKVGRALKLRPFNVVYKWAADFMITNIDHSSIAQRVIENPDIIQWLRSFGAAGEYIIGIISEDRTSVQS